MRTLVYCLWWLWCVMVMVMVMASMCDGWALNETDDRVRGQFREVPHRAWLGCLVPEDAVPDVKDRDYRSMLVLIQPATAVTIADRVAGYSRETPEVQAMFLDEKLNPMFCLVTSYTLHPEYRQGVKNTIALVHMEHFNINYESPYDVGQFFQNVTRVALDTCDDYYKRIGWSSMYEGIGMTSMRCYKEQRITRHACFYEPGCPLLHQVNGIYALAGISLKGPGCSNPSRFISLLPYQDFILASSSSRRAGDGPRGGDSRRDGAVSEPPPQGLEDYYDDLDESMIANLFKQKPDLFDDRSGWLLQEGDCGQGGKKVVYREQAEYKTTMKDTRGTYVLTLHDTMYKQYSCIELTCHCRRMSEPLFHPTQISQHHLLDKYVYKVPFKYLNGTIPPKIIFLTDEYTEYHGAAALIIYFVFEFDDKALINIAFYGRN